MGRVCNLVREELSESQFDSCNRMLARAYGSADRFIEGLGGSLTGANALDVASIALNYGLLNDNATVVADAYRLLHDEMLVVDDAMGDGIRRDGSFGQHRGGKFLN